MISTTYSGDIVTDRDIDRYVTAKLAAICETCPARQSEDMYDLCAQCPLTDVVIRQGRSGDRPRDTRDYMML